MVSCDWLKINKVYDSCCKKGLDMASIVSAGHISTTAVPRQTTKPNERVSSVNLKWSFGSNNYEWN